MGRPVRTASGTLFQISERQADPMHAEEVLVGADDLAAGQVLLVVLQGTPYPGRVRADPFEAAESLRFAIDLMIAGADAVLVIPGLPVSTTKVICQLIAGLCAGRTRPNIADVIRLTAAVRTAVEGAGGNSAITDDVRLVMSREDLQ
jgi:hypothetical protein